MEHGEGKAAHLGECNKKCDWHICENTKLSYADLAIDMSRSILSTLTINSSLGSQRPFTSPTT